MTVVARQHIRPCDSSITINIPLVVGKQVDDKSMRGVAYKVCALVAMYVCPEPMLTAAVIWTAQPQSTAAARSRTTVMLMSS